MDASLRQSHERWMLLAIHCASFAEGLVADNPPVGCVLTDRFGRLVCYAHTQPTGRPHAEQAAIDQAINTGRYEQLKGGTAYVTLEPCAHHATTAPCSQALIKAGIKHLFYAVKDPDPRVSGKGHAQLEAAGVPVKAGLCAEKAEAVMAGFLSRQRYQRPFISSKIATSSDHFISKDPAYATQLTNQTSKRYVHDLRSRADLLVTGIGTILADDPLLTARIAGLKTPPRLVLDTHLQIPLQSAIISSANSDIGKLMIAHGKMIDKNKAEQLVSLGVELIEVATIGGRIDIHELVRQLAGRQVNHMMIEAGARLNVSFMKAGLIDRIIWLTAPDSLGSGLAVFSSENKAVSTVDFQLPTAYTRTDRFLLEDDLVEIFRHDIST